jgi:hypothetical protein
MKTKLFLFLIIISFNLHAKKFIIEDFFLDQTDITARRYVKTDINGEKCALIRIFTNLKDLEFDSNLGVVAKEIKSLGEIWVYVSPGEKRLEFSAPDFMPEAFNFPLTIQSLSVYVLKLTSDDQPLRKIEGKGGLTINTNPEGVLVMIDGMPELDKRTPFELPGVFALDYKVVLIKDRYFPVDTTVTVEAEKNSSYMFQMKPRFSDVVITTNPSGALVTIDEAEAGRTPLMLTGEVSGLAHGERAINIQHKDCYAFNKVINIVPGKTNEFNFELNQINGTLSIRTLPEGANVFVDGIFLGITPVFNNKINMGNKIIDITKEGFTSVKHRIKIEENEQVFLSDTLNKSVNMVINTRPDGAEFLLNGNYMGVTPVRIPLVLGVNDFSFSKKDYVDQHVQENIDGTQLKFEYKIDLQQYEVHVLSEPDSANVYVRGEFKGVTPCKVYLTNEKTRIKFERAKFLPHSKKMHPGENDFVLKGTLRKRVKESRTVGFCFEKWDRTNDFKGRFDIGNFFIVKLGWNEFASNWSIGDVPFKGIGAGELNLSPTFHVTRYGEICPFVGVGYEFGVRDSLEFFDSAYNPSLASTFYSYGSYFYINVVKNFQIYFQVAKLEPLNEIRYDDAFIETESVMNKNWNHLFPGRFDLRTAFGIRLRLGGY